MTQVHCCINPVHGSSEKKKLPDTIGGKLRKKLPKFRRTSQKIVPSGVTWHQMKTLMLYYEIHPSEKNGDTLAFLMTHRSNKMLKKRHRKKLKEHLEKQGLTPDLINKFRKSWSATQQCQQTLEKLYNIGSKSDDPNAMYLMKAAVLERFSAGGETGEVFKFAVPVGDNLKVMVYKSVNQLPSQKCMDFTQKASLQCSILYRIDDGFHKAVIQEWRGDQLNSSSLDWGREGVSKLLAVVAELHSFGATDADVKLQNVILDVDTREVMGIDNQDTRFLLDFTEKDVPPAVTRSTAPPELINGNSIATIEQARVTIGIQPDGPYLFWWDVVAFSNAVPKNSLSVEMKDFLEKLRTFRPKTRNPSAVHAMRVFNDWQDARVKGVFFDIDEELEKLA